ncbi:uncharacterized protein EAF02_003621 [Botrytis sinoallii]|uniref:uncharacterized protein n=1 Tax=Botrytis sinoallii TaxID=1463999 RepID=UPI0018FF66DA|nr:uncharacterized protein EAF02_003621 [Botrytis sinoallii]KAF7886974.1 hypothetical protein EAF02_003621 [Botrytis sinoallii]
MNNPQTFNIINPNRGSRQIYYERVDSCSIWRSCLQYRPRVKDLKVLNPFRNKIRQMPHFLRKLRCRSSGGVRNKHVSLFSDTRKSSQGPSISIKAARTSGVEDQPLEQSPILPVQLTPEILDPTPQRVSVRTSKRQTMVGEPAIGRVPSPVYNANYGPYQPHIPSNSNHDIGMALTTSQTILNYSSPQQHTQIGNAQQRSDGENRGSVGSNGASSWGVLQIGEKGKGTELVDISTLVPAYLQPKRKLIAHKIPVDEVEHHPLPHSVSTKDLVQLLEVEASRQEQEKEEMEKITCHKENLREPRTPRDSRRCGQVWNSEETRKSFLVIEALDALALELRLT